MDLEKLTAEEIQELINKPHKCPYQDCCSYLEYQQCYNHSHVLCKNFEEWYDSKRPKDL